MAVLSALPTHQCSTLLPPLSACQFESLHMLRYGLCRAIYRARTLLEAIAAPASAVAAPTWPAAAPAAHHDRLLNTRSQHAWRLEVST